MDFTIAKLKAQQMGVLGCVDLVKLRNLAGTYYVAETLVNEYLGNLKSQGCNEVVDPNLLYNPNVNPTIDFKNGFDMYVQPGEEIPVVDEFVNIVKPVVAGYEDIQKWIIPVGLVVLGFWVYKQL